MYFLMVIVCAHHAYYVDENEFDIIVEEPWSKA
jgi:hypothetical protein